MFNIKCDVQQWQLDARSGDSDEYAVTTTCAGVNDGIALTHIIIKHDLDEHGYLSLATKEHSSHSLRDVIRAHSSVRGLSPHTTGSG